MKNIKRIAITAIFVLITVSVCFVQSSAAENRVTTDPTVFSDIVLGVGADETQKNVTWYSTEGISCAIDYAPFDGSSTSFPAEYRTVHATTKSSDFKYGYYVNHATITDLCENTEYVYRLRADNTTSELYVFNTGSFGEYEFLFAGDPQISTDAHGEQWADTLRKAMSNFHKAELLISAGDQLATNSADIGTEIAEEHYSYFFAEELTGITFAPTAGPAHDITPNDNTPSSFGEHFYLPNESDKYGVSASLGDYWYVYNNTLFMHLNMGDRTALESEHSAFITEAMRANPNAFWRIVVMHSSIFTTGSHSSPDYKYYETEIKAYREALAPQLTELGVDMVLGGHDHIYVRSKMMDGLEISDDVVINNTVTSPNGTLYICASSSTGSKFYDSQVSGDDAYYVAKEDATKRKSILRFIVTDESITLRAYYIDGSVPELFDTFTIYKEPHTHSLTPIAAQKESCTTAGNHSYWYCESCETYFKDADCLIITTPDEQKIPKTGHKWSDVTCTTAQVCLNDGCTSTRGRAMGHKSPDPTCTTDAICERCEEVTAPALGHEFAGECDTLCDREGCGYVREASYHTDADENLTCDVCEATLDPPAKTTDTNDDDSTIIILIFACAGGAAISAGAVVAVIIIRKKQKR